MTHHDGSQRRPEQENEIIYEKLKHYISNNFTRNKTNALLAFAACVLSHPAHARLPCAFASSSISTKGQHRAGEYGSFQNNRNGRHGLGFSSATEQHNRQF